MHSVSTAGEPQIDKHLSIDDTKSSSGEIFEDDNNETMAISSIENDDDSVGYYRQHSTESSADEPDQERTSVLQTYLHLLKGNIGPGCLSLPWAVSVMGIPLTIFTLVILCIITSFNCWAVVRWKRRYARDNRAVTYADVGELAYGPKFRTFVTACVCVTQLCVCTVFFSFMGDNISSVMRSVAPGISFLGNSRAIMSVLLPVVLLLSCVPNLRLLAPATIVGMILLLTGFGCIGGIIGINWDERPDELPTTDWKHVPLAMCAVMYSFEAINLVIPIEAAMQEPDRFDGIFVLAMTTVTAIYGTFSCLCVVAFGRIDDGSVTAFLMQNADEFSARNLVLAANFIVSFSVLVTYPLQLFPAINLVSQLRERRQTQQHQHQHLPAAPEIDDISVEENGNIDNDHVQTDEAATTFRPLDSREIADTIGRESTHFTRRGGIFQNHTTFQGDSPLLRAGLVLGTFLFAILIPNVQQLISLSGALAGSSAALVIPPLIELRSILESHHKFAPAVLLRYFLLLLGVVFVVVGTASSIVDIVKAFNERL